MDHKSFRRYSRRTQKLIYSLLADYSNHSIGKEPSSKVSDYQMWKTKKELKKLYLSHCEVNIAKLKPFNNLKDKIHGKILDVLKKDITDNSKADIIYNDVENIIREEFQLLTLKLDGTFSLSLNLLSQKSANKFVNWMFEFFLDNDIPMRKEIVQLMKESDNDQYIYNMLVRKKCAVCGSNEVDLDHYDNIGSEGYKNDDGRKTRFISLCRHHHTEKHNIGRDEFEKRYLIKGIWLKDNQIEELKEVYKNHFKAYNK